MNITPAREIVTQIIAAGRLREAMSAPGRVDIAMSALSSAIHHTGHYHGGDESAKRLLVKSIANHLNESGIRTRDGGRWGVDAVHKVLTRTTYIGRHRFNTKFWKSRERKPEAEGVEMMVLPIIGVADLGAVRTLLKTRGPAL